jgi:hypothetical protein
LTRNVGDSEPSAFVDDIPGRGPQPYVYAVHTYNPGQLGGDSPIYPDFPNILFDLSVSRGQLNGGSQRLQFQHWYNGHFNEPGLPTALGGGHEDPIFPAPVADIAHYRSCQAPTQRRSSGSISYSETTHEYVLFFICSSFSEPATTASCMTLDNKNICETAGAQGGAWFFSTLDADQYDLSSQGKWRAPLEVGNSWNAYSMLGCANGNGANFDGWYPSLMSAGSAPGHLQGTGWVFYMNGCEGGDTPEGRVYSTRYFTITSQ